ncbi:Uncharacterized protein APZ42_006695 [Daphnia magna]|uniref:Uncharacterized protein n=1 Tax=Daphnia magna TaxID=35525 RepID=A0A164FRA4_9CRUS|nr:Uncharacterized protein APZ42_006695 [Daphnia magna]
MLGKAALMVCYMALNGGVVLRAAGFRWYVFCSSSLFFRITNIITRMH